MSLLFSNPQTADFSRHWVRTSRTGQAVWFSILLRYFPAPFLVGVTSSGRNWQNDLTLVMLRDRRVIVLDVGEPRGHKARKRAVKSPKVAKGTVGRTRCKTRPQTKDVTANIATRSDFDVRRSAAFQHICRAGHSGAPTIGIIGRGSQFVMFEVFESERPGNWDYTYVQLEVGTGEDLGRKSSSQGLPWCVVDQAAGLDGVLR